MGFVKFMNSSAGRILRAAVGAVLIVVGLASVGGAGGWILAAAGALFVAVGAGGVCLFGPLFGVDLRGNPKA